MINRTWWFLLSILFLNLIAYYFIIYNNHKNTQKLLHKIQKLKNNIENYIKNIKSQNFKLETTNQQLYSCNSTLLHLSTTLETLENEKKVLDAQISNQDSLLQFYSLRFGRIETPNEFTMRYKKVTLKYHNLKNFKKRKEKVLIIDGFPFNKEFDILKLRLNMYKNEVDYHIIVESKFTQTWKPKRLYFNERKEEFKEFEHKIIHIIIDHHPEKLQGVQEDWNNEVYVREIIGKEGLLKIPHLKDEDMVFITDVDELIDPDIYWFTKNYEGYSFPISISIRWSFYGFYYRVNRPTIISVGASAEYIKNQLNYNTHKLRATQGAFTFGEGNNYAGWHCSWVNLIYFIFFSVFLLQILNINYIQLLNYILKIRIHYLKI